MLSINWIWWLICWEHHLLKQLPGSVSYEKFITINQTWWFYFCWCLTVLHVIDHGAVSVSSKVLMKFIKTGKKWESPALFKQYAEEETSSVISEIPKCRPTCSSVVRKNVGIWTKGSAFCWRGISVWSRYTQSWILSYDPTFSCFRPLQIPILRAWLRLSESLLLNQWQRWNSNLRGEG